MIDTKKALYIIEGERDKQKELWGWQQNSLFQWLSILGEEYGKLCRAVNETCLEGQQHPEFGGMDNIFCQMVHVAAVATAMLEDVAEN